MARHKKIERRREIERRRRRRRKRLKLRARGLLQTETSTVMPEASAGVPETGAEETPAQEAEPQS